MDILWIKKKKKKKTITRSKLINVDQAEFWMFTSHMIHNTHMYVCMYIYIYHIWLGSVE